MARLIAHTPWMPLALLLAVTNGCGNDVIGGNPVLPLAGVYEGYWYQSGAVDPLAFVLEYDPAALTVKLEFDFDMVGIFESCFGTFRAEVPMLPGAKFSESGEGTGTSRYEIDGTFDRADRVSGFIVFGIGHGCLALEDGPFQAIWVGSERLKFRCAGIYDGSFDGDGYGFLTFVVDAHGIIEGEALSLSREVVTIYAAVASDETIGGTLGQFTLSGAIEPGTCSFSGEWFGFGYSGTWEAWRTAREP